MTTGLDTDQLQYLKDVLGLSDVLMPYVGAAAAPAAERVPVEVRGAMSNARLLILLPLGSREFPLHGPLEDLIERMVKAMKIEPAQACRVSWPFSRQAELPPDVASVVAEAGDRPLLLFGVEEAKSIIGDSAELGAWQTLQNTRVMVTFSPRELVNSNENKRLAWVHLQAVMKELA